MFRSEKAFLASLEQREKVNRAFCELLSGKMSVEEYQKVVEDSMKKFYETIR